MEWEPFIFYDIQNFTIFFKAKNIKMCVYFKDALDFADIFSFLSCLKEFTLDPEMATFLYE